MGGTVRKPYAQAIETVARLQEAVRDGLPVLIPGAREMRTASADATAIIADPVAASDRAAAVFDRLRLEQEPERRKRTLLARLWRGIFRGVWE
jgi:alpha-beta hydrolase superfamily lysophospholipase